MLPLYICVCADVSSILYIYIVHATCSNYSNYYMLLLNEKHYVFL